MVLGVIFLWIAFGVGRTYFIFGRWTRPTPADYVAFVNQECAPALRALAAYHREFGSPPWDGFNAVHSKNPKFDEWFTVAGGELRFEAYPTGERICYRASANGGDWMLEGPFLNGPVPAPAVVEFRPEAMPRN